MTVTALILALLIGLSMGVLGGGGSLIAVPALTFLLHFAAKDAVVISLVIVGVVAAVGAAGALMRGALPLPVAAVVGGAATIGASAGSVVGSRLTDRVQLSVLAAIMLAAAISMWRNAGVEAIGPVRTKAPFLALLGVAVGAITGLVGVGGGFLIVPALVLGARQPIRTAAATSLFVIALSAASAIPGYIGHVTLDWSFIVPFAALGGLGVVCGGMVAHFLPQRRLQQAFAAALIVLASYVLTQA